MNNSRTRIRIQTLPPSVYDYHHISVIIQEIILEIIIIYNLIRFATIIWIREVMDNPSRSSTLVWKVLEIFLANGNLISLWVNLAERKKKLEVRRPDMLWQTLIYEILHYLGSWQSYNYRDNDARKGSHTKNHEVWKETSNKTNGEKSSVIHPWLHGFTKLVGKMPGIYHQTIQIMSLTTKKIISRNGPHNSMHSQRLCSKNYWNASFFSK